MDCYRMLKSHLEHPFHGMIAQTPGSATYMPAPAPSLLFVYNADSGLFNTLADIGHKLFAPDSYPCDLCALTHGYLREKAQWRRFVEELGVPCQFLHRDQFRHRYPDDTTPLPASFWYKTARYGPAWIKKRLPPARISNHCNDSFWSAACRELRPAPEFTGCREQTAGSAPARPFRSGWWCGGSQNGCPAPRPPAVGTGRYQDMCPW